MYLRYQLKNERPELVIGTKLPRVSGRQVWNFVTKLSNYVNYIVKLSVYYEFLKIIIFNPRAICELHIYSNLYSTTKI